MLRKSIFVLIAAAVLLSGVAAFAATTLPNVVATVNGEKITKEDLTSALIDWDAPMALDQLIMYRLVGQEARKAGVVVTAKEINARFDDMKRNLPAGQTFEDMLLRNQMTLGHAYAFMKMQIQMEGVLRKQVKITQEDLDSYRRAEHILIRSVYAADPKEKEKNDAAAKAKIEQIAGEIKAGLSFEDAARKYSEDPGTKDKGGDLDYFGRNQMAPEFDKAVFEMKPGQISDPIKTAYGYHLIKLISTGGSATGADKKKLEEMIIQSKMGDLYRDWILTIRNKAKIVNVIAPIKPQPVAPPVTQRPPSGVQPPQPPPPSAQSDAEHATGAGNPPPPPPGEEGTPPPPPPGPDNGGTPPPPPQ